MISTDANGRRHTRDRAWLGVAAVAVGTMLAVAAATLLTSKVDSDVKGAVLAASVTGTISVALAALGFLAGRDQREERDRMRMEDSDERDEIRREEVILRALEYFTGKTQRRNVGISIVEFHWETTPRLRGVFVPLLVNQAVYLLEQSEQTSERHEADNLRRIMQLLLGATATAGPAAADYRALLGSIGRRLEREEPSGRSVKEPTGVLVELADLKWWNATLVREVPALERSASS